MAAGNLALVLHAHLPYVRSGDPGSLEEDWYFQALQECYLPLLAMLEEAAAHPQQQPRLTVSFAWQSSHGRACECSQIAVSCRQSCNTAGCQKHEKTFSYHPQRRDS